MSKRSTRVAWSMLAIFVVCLAASVALSVLNGSFQRDTGVNLALYLAFTAFMVVGAVIAGQRPGNAVGWLFSAVGLLSITGVLAMQYAGYAYITRPGSLPGGHRTAARRTTACAARRSGSFRRCCSGPGKTWTTSRKRCARCRHMLRSSPRLRSRSAYGTLS